jgi:hypothetical protein
MTNLTAQPGFRIGVRNDEPLLLNLDAGSVIPGLIRDRHDELFIFCYLLIIKGLRLNSIKLSTDFADLTDLFVYPRQSA